LIYFKVLVLNLIIVLLLPVILLQALWVRKKTAVLPDPDGERVLASADSKLLLTNNVLVIGDSAAAGVGATTQMGALTGLLYSNLVKHGPTRVTLNGMLKQVLKVKMCSSFFMKCLPSTFRRCSSLLVLTT